MGNCSYNEMQFQKLSKKKNDRNRMTNTTKRKIIAGRKHNYCKNPKRKK